MFFENTVGIGEIVHNEQFLIFPQYFVPVWRTSAIFIKFKIAVSKALVFMCLQYKCFENTVGKGEIVHNEQILLFLRVSSANTLNVEESKICRLGMD